LTTTGLHTAAAYTARLESTSDLLVCRLEGELDASRAAQVRDLMAMLCSQRRLVLDLSDVPFIDSAGLGALISGIRRIHEHGGRVVVSSCRSTVARLLRTVGFDRVAPIAAGRDEALALLTLRPALVTDRPGARKRGVPA
jgi:anti-sigma B factor antagonist